MPLGSWEKVIADYRSTGVNLGEHPMALLREEVGEGLLRSSQLREVEDGATVEVAGMVVARQRPETAKGIVFMLLEDEHGTVNLIVSPAVYERRRALVRAAPLLRARGRLERREGATNVIVEEVGALQRSDRAPADVRRIDSARAKGSTRGLEQVEAGEASLAARRRARELAVAELRCRRPCRAQLRAAGALGAGPLLRCCRAMPLALALLDVLRGRGWLRRMGRGQTRRCRSNAD